MVVSDYHYPTNYLLPTWCPGDGDGGGGGGFGEHSSAPNTAGRVFVF